MSDYDAGNRSVGYIKAQTRTNVDGEWTGDMWLDAEDYTFVFEKQGVYQESTKEVTVS